jgi:hypothetical protein
MTDLEKADGQMAHRHVRWANLLQLRQGPRKSLLGPLDLAAEEANSPIATPSGRLQSLMERAHHPIVLIVKGQPACLQQ